MKVGFKLLHENAKPPTKVNQSEGNLDAGWDFTCVRDKEFFTPTSFSRLYDQYQSKYIFVLQPKQQKLFRTGISIVIPYGWCLMFCDRSGMGGKKIIHHTAGLIDSPYTGELLVSLVNLSDKEVVFTEGDKIIQGVFIEVPHIEWEQMEDLPETNRGSNGFGSSDSPKC